MYVVLYICIVLGILHSIRYIALYICIVLVLYVLFPFTLYINFELYITHIKTWFRNHNY